MLSLQTLEWCPCPCIPWNSSRLLWKIIIFISFSEHKNSGLFFFFIKFVFLAPSKHWTYPLSFETLVPFFLTLDFLPYPSKHWNSDLTLPNTGILTLSFQTLYFWSSPFKHWNSGLILSNIGMLALSFQTL